MEIDQHSWTDQVGTYQDCIKTARKLPPRECKTAALLKIHEQELPYPKGAFRKENIQDLDKVLVAIAPSTSPQAGLELYLLSGPAEDKFAPPDTRVTTYDGIHFRTRAEQDQLGLININPFMSWKVSTHSWERQFW